MPKAQPPKVEGGIRLAIKADSSSDDDSSDDSSSSSEEEEVKRPVRAGRRAVAPAKGKAVP